MLVIDSCRMRNKVSSRSRGKPIGLIRKIEIDLDIGAFGKTFEIGTSSGNKSKFLDQRRMQEMRNGTRGADRFIEENTEILKLLAIRRPVLERICHHFGGDEVLAQPVMQIAGDLAALLVLRVQELGA